MQHFAAFWSLFIFYFDHLINDMKRFLKEQWLYFKGKCFSSNLYRSRLYYHDCTTSLFFFHRHASSSVDSNSSIAVICIPTSVFSFCFCQRCSRKPSPAIRGSLYLQLSIWIVVVNLEKGNSGSLQTLLIAARGEAGVRL